MWKKMNARRDAAHAGLIALALVGGAACAQDAGQHVPGRGEQREMAPLPSIVVTATASARSEADAPASVSVIDGESLRRRPVNDLADAVRGAVGIGLDSVGLGRRGVSIRGMSSEHTLMLVDGQRINSSASAIAHSDFELGWVSAEAIERVEVVRGPMSSLYGSEALGGVVNVITRSATDRWQGSASGYALINDHGLDGNQYKGGFYLGGPLVPGRLGLNVWGEYRYRDALRDAGDAALTALDRQRATTGHVGLSWTPDVRQRIDLSASAGNEDQEGLRSSTASPFYKAENEVQRRRYSLSHAGEWDWGSSRVRLYRSTLDRSARRSDGADSTAPNRFTDTVLDGRLGFRAGASHALTLGAELRRESLEDPNVTRSGRKSQTHHALFAQDEILLGERWELVLGGRFDRHEDYGWETSPRAYLLFHPSEALTFKAGAGRGFKAPTLKQLSPEFESRAAMGGRGIIRGNPDLKPETNRSFELGAAYDRGAWSASATVFHNDVRNLIETQRQPTCFEPRRVCLEYENVARVRLRGVELSAGADLSRQWRVDASYTYLDARDRTNGGRLADRSRHRASATVSWMAMDRLATRLQAEYTGAQYRSAAERDRPGYTLLHWYVDHELGRSLALHAGIENLTDERLANDDADLHGRADEGRRYFAGLTAKF
ncbi:TonB-dependent receptor domain-containing protein [Thauera linaloolentis]|uniref:Outer membrane protein n=1 Tax=Thauera linaloolentis (strain DSM 12138 / JCM 21573 / CCUG 41526 / CIP 105981 / IAM 15112 / NBRC 102519 / 47Lol) TaxID=1123367 RepID=N6Z406_THAL4|nr:TonB-dependent receptor [Thauera linaloolentis]ENO89317.1 outer membrane protein [Thauera linaloolentis 47Lol = DSM 12138]MCM8565034.1 TonB-dependent receptor [Thauera linaloolentis]